MGKIGILAVLLLVLVLGPARASAADVRYEQKDGVTYRVTRHVVRQPMITTHYEPRQQTVYRHQLKTELRDSYRTVRTPVTDFQCVNRWHGRWNPFVEPYVTQELVPVKSWDYRTEVVQVPVARTEWIPETRVVQVPVTTRRMVDHETINRIVVRADPPSVTAARQAGVGGVARMTSDPPRKSTGSGWHAARDAVRR